MAQDQTPMTLEEARLYAGNSSPQPFDAGSVDPAGVARPSSDPAPDAPTAAAPSPAGIAPDFSKPDAPSDAPDMQGMPYWQQEYAKAKDAEKAALSGMQSESDPVMSRMADSEKAWARQASPKLEAPPKYEDYQITPAKWTAFTALMMGLAVVFGHAQGARGAMVAMTGAMEGFSKGNIEAGKQHREEFNTQMNAIRDRNNAILAEYNEAKGKYKDDLEGLRGEMERIAYKYKIPLTSAQAAKGDALGMMQSLNALQATQNKLKEAHEWHMGSLGIKQQEVEIKRGGTPAQQKTQTEVETGWNFWTSLTADRPQFDKAIHQTGGLMSDPIYQSQFTNARKTYPGENQEQHAARVNWLNQVSRMRPGQPVPPPPEMNFPLGRKQQGAGAQAAPKSPAVPGASQFSVTPPGGNRTAAPAPAGVVRQGTSRQRPGWIYGSDGKLYPPGTTFGQAQATSANPASAVDVMATPLMGG